MVKIIIFDIGNVILRFDYIRAARRFATAFNRPVEEIEQPIFFSELERDYTKGRLTSEEFYEKLKEEIGFTTDFETFKDIWNDIFWPNAGIEKVISGLKEKGYRLGAISNTNDMHFTYWLSDFPTLKEIDVFMPSHEAGARKPGDEIYNKALEKFGVKPEEAIFVDDLAENAESACKMGMHGIHFETPTQLVEALKEHEIELD